MCVCVCVCIYVCMHVCACVRACGLWLIGLRAISLETLTTFYLDQ